MKKIVAFILLSTISISAVTAQIKIGDNPQNIDPSSVLELESNTRVLVITRVTTAEMEAIVPQRGGMVYNTDASCIYYYDGTQWVNLCVASGLTLTNDAIESPVSTISITETATGYNLEVLPNSIRTENIADGTINGNDIQDNSIGESKLGADSVSANELRDNSVGSAEIVDGSIRPTDLANTAPDQVLTTDENGVVEWVPGTNLTQDVALDIAQNATDIADHILEDTDTDDTNELTDLAFDAGTNILSLTRSESVGGQQVDLSGLNNPGTDNQALSINGNIISLARGGQITLPAAAAEVDGIIGNEVVDATDGTLVRVGNGTVGNQYTLDVAAGGIDTAELANNAVTNAKLANNAVRTENIFNATITEDDIAPSEPSPANTQILTTNTGGNVEWIDLPEGTVNTDNQSLSITGNQLSIQRGNTIPIPVANGSETILNQGTNVTITGNGTAATPYVINAEGGATGISAALRDSIAFPRMLNENFILIGDATNNADKVDLTTIPFSELAGANDSISIGGFRIIDLEGPVADDDAATKAYVDASASAGISTTLRDSITFPRTLNENFILIGDATNNADKVDLTTIPLSRLAGANDSISMGNFRIKDLAVPIVDSDAATKAYVDASASAGISTGLRDSIAFPRTLNENFILIGDATNNADKVDLTTIPFSELAGANDSISIGGFRIIDLEGPVADDDAATKKYVDDTASAGISAGLRDSIAFPRTLNENFILIGDATDNADKVDLTTIPFSELAGANDSISIGGFRIIDLEGPVADDDAATKKYVDDTASAGISAGLRDSIAFPRTLDENFILIGNDANTAVKTDIATIPLSELASANDSISMGGFRIIDLEGPVADDDAATKAYVDGNVAGTAGSIFFADTDGTATENNAQLFWDDVNNRLGIGEATRPLTNKLTVDGSTRTSGLLNSNGTAGTPSYRFSNDTNLDTGMYFPAQDQLGFSVGGGQTLLLRESVANGLEIIAEGSLELTEQLLDENGSAGNDGDVLTATATGTEWKSPQIVAMGKSNGANSINSSGIQSIMGGAGINTVNFNPARPDNEYIIQLTVVGDNRIYVTTQTTGAFTVEIRRNSDDMLVVAEWYFTVLDF
ncbi:hypothetical protein [Maribacter sp. 2210JD10-5]|uniref:hypothetical protein n=1 Tax=Maribacter sp. 2210JD10-5 TaxID=3386272 RepID=UPI0039BCB7AE